MESQLADLERKIDDLLASVDLPTSLVHNNPIIPAAGEGLRKESDEGSSSAAERNRLEKAEEEESGSGNNKMTEKGSK